MRDIRRRRARRHLPGVAPLTVRFASFVTALLAATSIVLGVGGIVAANGIGDLYAATPAGVLELHVETARVVNTVPLAPSPTELAFSPDGRTLYAAAGGRHVTTIDIESITATGTIDLPDAAAALAHPKGDELVLAFPSSKTLGVLDTTSQNVIQSSELPGAVDLLATDRRDNRVLAAQTGGGWVSLFDPGSGSIGTTKVAGHVSAIAFDRADGLALVATQTPNRLTAVDLSTMKTAWSATLGGVPAAVAALGEKPLVAVGSSVWTATKTGSTKWADAASAITSMAASDEGSVLYAQEAGQIEAYNTSGAEVRTIKLAGTRAPVAIAPVPHASSIANGAGGTGTDAATRSGSSGRGSGTGAGDGFAPGAGKPPSTDTVIDDAARWIEGRQVLPGAIAVAVAILVLGQVAIYLYERRGAS